MPLLVLALNAYSCTMNITSFLSFKNFKEIFHIQNGICCLKHAIRAAPAGRAGELLS